MVVENWVEPPCRHKDYTPGCMWCFSWLNYTPTLRQKMADFYRAKYPKWAYRDPLPPEKLQTSLNRIFPIKQAAVTGPIQRQAITIPAKAERISLPVRSPCKYEGKVLLSCRACNENYKVRHCEHPQADWEFCARAATPINDGQNCQTCNLYAEQGT